MHDDARRLIDALSLSPHPEGGFFREVFRSALPVAHPSGAGTRPAGTAIYYLLPAGAFSALHRVTSDEIWHHYEGDPVELHTLDEAGTHTASLLGRDLHGGERPLQVVRAGLYQAARPRGERFALLGCTVSPGFDFADFEMPPCAELLRRFPGQREIIERLTR